MFYLIRSCHVHVHVVFNKFRDFLLLTLIYAIILFITIHTKLNIRIQYLAMQKYVLKYNRRVNTEEIYGEKRFASEKFILVR